MKWQIMRMFVFTVHITGLINKRRGIADGKVERPAKNGASFNKKRTLE